MAYEPKAGSFSLFKNDRKEKDSHPDYKGDGMAPDGTPCWISAWIKKGAKGTFMSLSVQPKEERQSSDSRSAPAPSRDVPFDDEIPW